MTQEDKELLLKDLSARLPCGVIVAYKNRENKEGRVELGYGNIGYVAELGRGWWVACKPYLRPMSSMTEEEWEGYQKIRMIDWVSGDVNGTFINASLIVDWLNAHHFDYRDLIEKSLALEAPEDMYNLKEK